jgi:alpha-maltose-1-phosphate synthase
VTSRAERAKSPPLPGPRILGLSEALDPNAVSGIPRFLFGAVGRRFQLQPLSYGPRGPQRAALAAATFRPSRSRWRSEFHTGLLAQRVMSWLLQRRSSRLDLSFDLSLQALGWVRRQPRPYTLYLDQTRLMAERGWPDWMPIERHQRTRILARESEMYGGASHLFTMGRSAAESLVEEYGVASDRVTVVGGGLSLDALPAPRELPAEPVILFVGKDFERKGGALLIEAFRRIRLQLPDATLHIVGTNREFDDTGIKSWGRIASRERIAELYSSARVFTLPSHYEPFGLVLIEAMAFGVPCVGTSVESIPWILGGGDAGRLVPPGDAEGLAAALIELLTDDRLARSYANAGRRRVEEELTWDRVVDRMAPGLMRAAGNTANRADSAG